jgi:hypothetical protein
VGSGLSTTAIIYYTVHQSCVKNQHQKQNHNPPTCESTISANLTQRYQVANDAAT